MFAHYLLASVLGLPEWQKIAIITLGVIFVVILTVNVVNILILKKLRKAKNTEIAAQPDEGSGKITVIPQWHILIVNKQEEERKEQAAFESKGGLMTEEKTSQSCKGDNAACELKEECGEGLTKLDEPLSIVDENGEVTELVKDVDYSSGTAIVIRYKKSFTAKLIQCNDVAKNWYSRLKNAFLSYEKVKSRISWEYESFTFNKNQLAKIGVRGKTLCLYLALNPDDLSQTKYKVEHNVSKKLEELPCLFRIKNSRRVSQAIELFAKVAENYNLVKGTEKNQDYYLPYEHNQTLIERNLIKESCCRENFEDFLKKRQKSAFDVSESDIIGENENISKLPEGDIQEVCSTNPDTGVVLVDTYNKAFIASLTASSQATQNFYNELKNEILSYNWTNGSDISADIGGKDKFVVAQFRIKDGILEMYIALNAFGHTGAYAVAGENYQTTPCPFYVRDENDVKDAKDLIAALAGSFERPQAAERRQINFISQCSLEYTLPCDSEDNYEEFVITHKNN